MSPRGSKVFSCHVPPAPPLTVHEHHLPTGRGAQRRRDDDWLFSCRVLRRVFRPCTCWHYNATRVRRRRLSVEKERWERGASDREQGQGQSARRTFLKVQRLSRALEVGDIACPSMENHCAALQTTLARWFLCSADEPKPAASEDSALTDMKLGRCVADYLRSHLRAAGRPLPPH